MNKIATLIFTLLFFNISFNQSDFTLDTDEVATESSSDSIIDFVHKKNKFYIDLGGATGLYSLNYERTLVQNKTVSLAGRLGTSFFVFNGTGPDYWVILGGNINFHMNKSNSILIGAGQVYYNSEIFDFFEATGKKRVFELYTYLELGYKVHLSNSFYLSAKYTPLLLYNEPNEEGTILDHWGGLSLGFCF